jgi:sec-independent protein translocase protein TatC
MTENRTIEQDAIAGPVLIQEEERKPLLQHLEDLRWCVLRSFLWVGLGSAVTFRYAKEILSWLIEPVGSVVFLSPVEPFLAYLKVSVIAGIALASPLVAWEFWRFLAPALFPKERRGIVVLVPLTIGLFFLGAWFAWKFLLPTGLKFLMSFSSDTMVPMITVGSYLSFAGWLLIGCGLFFQMPIGVVGLVRLGTVKPATLLKQWRLAVLAILILSAVLTPTPDIATQLLLAVPMFGLYLISVALAFVAARK